MVRTYPSLLFLFFLTILVTSCKYEEVTIEDIKGFKINKMDGSNIFFQFELKLNNPNNYTLNVKDSDLMIDFNGKNLGQLNLDEKISIPANSKDFVLVKSSVSPKGSSQDIMTVMMGTLFTGVIDVRIKGEVSGGPFLFSKKVQIDHSEKVRLDNR